MAVFIFFKKNNNCVIAQDVWRPVAATLFVENVYVKNRQENFVGQIKSVYLVFAL